MEFSDSQTILDAWKAASPDTHAAWLEEQEALREKARKEAREKEEYNREVVYPRLLMLWYKMVPATAEMHGCWKEFTFALTEDIRSQFEVLASLPLGTVMKFASGYVGSSINTCNRHAFVLAEEDTYDERPITIYAVQDRASKPAL
jgi:hypothetical protein